MRHVSPFVIVEVAMFVTAEAINVLAPTRTPLALRTVLAIGIALFSAAYVFRPRMRTKAKDTAYIAVSVLLALGLTALSAIAIFLAGLLVTRTMETFPGNRRAYAVGAVSMAAVFALAPFTATHIEHRPGEIEGLVIVLCVNVLVVVLAAVVTDLRMSQGALATANADLASRARERERMAALGERYRLARDLHDDVGHGLTAISVQLEGAEKLRGAQPQEADRLVSQARSSAATTLAAIRRTVSHLREDPLVHGDLAEVIQQLGQEFAASSPMHVDVRVGQLHIKDPLIVTNVERIVREALVNVARHSNASRVVVALDPAGKQVEIMVEDDGIGFEVDGAAGNGLDIMRERIAIVGGVCTIQSSPGEGTRVRVTVPTQ